MSGTGTAVIGRERELASVGAFVSGIAAPAALVLEGDAGIGKTALWEVGVASAAAAGHRVLGCRPVPAETDLAFAAVADLLADELDEGLKALPEPQRRALRVALLLDEPVGPPPDARAIGAAVLAVIRQACSRASVLLAVDDVQWLDGPSDEVLRFAMRRVRSEPIGLLVTRRGTDEELPLGLSRTAMASATRQLTVGPLGIESLSRLIGDRFGASLPRPVLRRIAIGSGGNPFYALEIARALGGAKLGPGDPLPVPATLAQLLQARVAALPEDVGRLLEIVATLYDRRLATVSSVARDARLGGTIDTAVAAGVLVVRDGRLEFQHPLLASCVYSDMGPERRRQLHRRLAGRDARNEAGAVHRALAAELPEATLADELDRAADVARRRGASGSAARYLERAAELTPVVDACAHARRVIAAADFHTTAGDPGRGASLLEALIAGLPAGGTRAEALSLLGWISPGGDLESGAKLIAQALAEAAGDDRVTGLAHLRLGLIEWIRGDLDASITHRLTAAELAERIAEPGLIARTLSSVGFAIGLRDCIVPDASRRAVQVERSLPDFLGQYSPSIELAQLLMYDGAVSDARTMLHDALDRAAAAGDEGARCNCLYRLAVLERRAGDWERGREYSDETRDLNAQAGTEQEYASCLAVGALLDAGMGRLDDAREASRIGLAAAERMDDTGFAIHHRGALGLAELSNGDPEAALNWLVPGTDELMRQGLGEVSGYPSFQHAVDAAVEAGQLDCAERLVTYLERLVARTGRTWTHAIALRGRGLIDAARGDLETAQSSLERAVAAHRPILEPLELGRTFLALGRVHRRAKRKREARETLQRAAALFADLPAPIWQAKAQDEIARLGIRTRPGELTETEGRIAALAAAGMTNPEIAAATYVSRKTVEANLSKVYRKLGVRSRVELARKLPPSQDGDLPD